MIEKVIHLYLLLLRLSLWAINQIQILSKKLKNFIKQYTATNLLKPDLLKFLE